MQPGRRRGLDDKAATCREQQSALGEGSRPIGREVHLDRVGQGHQHLILEGGGRAVPHEGLSEDAVHQGRRVALGLATEPRRARPRVRERGRGVVAARAGQGPVARQDRVEEQAAAEGDDRGVEAEGVSRAGVLPAGLLERDLEPGGNDQGQRAGEPVDRDALVGPRVLTACARERG